MKDLKPCPFCGNTVIVLCKEFSNLKGSKYLRCQNCRCRTKTSENVNELKKLWNRRTTTLIIKKKEGIQNENQN